MKTKLMFRIMVPLLFVATLAFGIVGWTRNPAGAATTTSNAQVSSARYVATAFEDKETGENWRLDHSFAIMDYETNTDYDAYFIYLGKIDWVPIASNTPKFYNGVTPIELTYSTTQTTQESVTKSMATTISHTTQTVDTHVDSDSTTDSDSKTITNTNVVNVESSTKFKVPFIMNETIKVGYSHTWNDARQNSHSGTESHSDTHTDSITDTTSRTDTYQTFSSWATSNTETARFTIGGHGEDAGFYRYALMATCDVYVAVVHDLNDDDWGYQYSVFARPDSLFEGIDYSTTNQFGVGENAMALRFDTAIVECLSESFTVSFMIEDSVYETQSVYNGRFVKAITEQSFLYNDMVFIGWSVDGETVVDVTTYQITGDMTFIAVFSSDWYLVYPGYGERIHGDYGYTYSWSLEESFSVNCVGKYLKFVFGAKTSETSTYDFRQCEVVFDRNGDMVSFNDISGFHYQISDYELEFYISDNCFCCKYTGSRYLRLLSVEAID